MFNSSSFQQFMESIRQLYKIGNGPSSSHTMGPRKAAIQFLHRPGNAMARKFEVTLYGALAATGEGHLTDKAIMDVLSQHGRTEIIWQPDIVLPFHTNGMVFRSFGDDGKEIASWWRHSGGRAVAPGAGIHLFHDQA